MESFSTHANESQRPPPAPDEDQRRERPPPAPDEGIASVHRSLHVPSSGCEREVDDAKPDPAVGDFHPPGDVSLPMSDKLLREISGSFSNFIQCFCLAINLKIEVDDVVKLFDVPYSDTVAYEIMKKWIKLRGCQATGPALHAALCNAAQHLGDKFEHRLNGRGSGQSAMSGEDSEQTTSAEDSLVISSRHGADCHSDDVLLKEIGKAISSHEQCIKLALKLKIGDDNVYKLIEAPFTDALAYEVLISWIEEHGEEATGSLLHAVLQDAESGDVADHFRDQLIGRAELRLLVNYHSSSAPRCCCVFFL